MSKRKRFKQFEASLKNNMLTYYYYLDRLIELATSTFEWFNLPKQPQLPLNIRYLERILCFQGSATFFRDNDLEFYMWLHYSNQDTLNVYNEPTHYRAYASNGYNIDLTSNDSVLIYNNYLHAPSINYLDMYAMRLWDLDRSIDVNARAQKTPVLLSAPIEQRLSILNLYKEVDGNAPVIYGDNKLSPDSIKVIKTDAPYTADRLYQLKCNIWNEALTYLGIPNVSVNKKERLVTDEVARNQGGAIASRYSRLESRREAVKRINDMFGLDIEVNYRDFSDDELSISDVSRETLGGDVDG